MKNMKAVIFDMDGVLLDTETICEKTWDIAAREMNLSDIQETFLKCLGTTKKETTTREIITTAGNKTTENKYIGNYTIELLSGKTITVQNSTSKYIVSTRTETSEITKNGSRYKVSKLIIRYNTGAEQVLETVEEKIG